MKQKTIIFVLLLLTIVLISGCIGGKTNTITSNTTVQTPTSTTPTISSTTKTTLTTTYTPEIIDNEVAQYIFQHHTENPSVLISDIHSYYGSVSYYTVGKHTFIGAGEVFINPEDMSAALPNVPTITIISASSTLYIHNPLSQSWKVSTIRPGLYEALETIGDGGFDDNIIKWGGTNSPVLIYFQTPFPYYIYYTENTGWILKYYQTYSIQMHCPPMNNLPPQFWKPIGVSGSLTFAYYYCPGDNYFLIGYYSSTSFYAYILLSNTSTTMYGKLYTYTGSLSTPSLPSQSSTTNTSYSGSEITPTPNNVQIYISGHGSIVTVSTSNGTLFATIPEEYATISDIVYSILLIKNSDYTEYMKQHLVYSPIPTDFKEWASARYSMYAEFSYDRERMSSIIDDEDVDSYLPDTLVSKGSGVCGDFALYYMASLWALGRTPTFIHISFNSLTYGHAIAAVGNTAFENTVVGEDLGYALAYWYGFMGPYTAYYIIVPLYGNITITTRAYTKITGYPVAVDNRTLIYTENITVMNNAASTSIHIFASIINGTGVYIMNDSTTRIIQKDEVYTYYPQIFGFMPPVTYSNSTWYGFDIINYNVYTYELWENNGTWTASYWSNYGNTVHYYLHYS